MTGHTEMQAFAIRSDKDNGFYYNYSKGKYPVLFTTEARAQKIIDYHKKLYTKWALSEWNQWWDQARVINVIMQYGY